MYFEGAKIYEPSINQSLLSKSQTSREQKFHISDDSASVFENIIVKPIIISLSLPRLSYKALLQEKQ